LRVSPVAALVAMTVASLTTAPLGSVTVPVIVPLLDWAAAGNAKATAHKSAAAQRESGVLLSLLMNGPRVFNGWLTAVHLDLLERSRCERAAD
jgi:hypothetical protein